MKKDDKNNERDLNNNLIGIILSGLLFLFIANGFDIYQEDEYYLTPMMREYMNAEWAVEEEECDVYKVTVTKYNPVPEQCDSDPLITADGSVIDTLQLRSGNLKWIAISRDLRKYFNYGDTVIIESYEGEIDGEYVVRDTMNPRWTDRVDLLSPCGDSLGKWENVFIRKKKEEGY